MNVFDLKRTNKVSASHMNICASSYSSYVVCAVFAELSCENGVMDSVIYISGTFGNEKL
jgi:hypothetical protein